MLAAAQNPVVGRCVALVVGNESYSWKPLAHPVNDARSVAARLRAAGFESQNVFTGENLGVEAFANLQRLFLARLAPGDTAIVFFSGHAVAIGGNNYLFPVDLPAEASPERVRARAISAQALLDSMKQAGAATRVLFLDACRDNPLASRKPGTFGLDPMPAPAGSGTLVLLSAQPGGIAADPASAWHSLFAKHLIRQLARSGLELQAATAAVTAAVTRESGGAQRPARFGGLTRPLVLREPDPGVPDPPLADDAEAWALVENSNDLELLDLFAARFPSSALAEMARLRVAEIGDRRTKAGPPPARPRALQERRGPDGMTYVWVPPGDFLAGCSPGDGECYPEEKPARRAVIAQGFWIGQTEVTQEAYQRVTGTAPSKYRGPRRPVETVTWRHAKAYCETIGLRLPTGDEWEYAARAGSSASRYGSLPRIAWFRDNSGSEPEDAGSREANRWGVQDMLGNVWEFTSSTSETGRYDLRGGSWSNTAREIRASMRITLEPDVAVDDTGFRCVGTLPQR